MQVMLCLYLRGLDLNNSAVVAYLPGKITATGLNPGGATWCFPQLDLLSVQLHVILYIQVKIIVLPEEQFKVL